MVAAPLGAVESVLRVMGNCAPSIVDDGSVLTPTTPDKVTLVPVAMTDMSLEECGAGDVADGSCSADRAEEEEEAAFAVEWGCIFDVWELVGNADIGVESEGTVCEWSGGGSGGGSDNGACS